MEVGQHLDVDVHVEEFPGQLSERLSDKLNVPARSMSLGELLNPICNWRDGRKASEEFHSGDLLCILCSPSSSPASLAKRENGSALRGAVLPGTDIALVYYASDGGVTVWHEILHLFGADDCYEPMDHTCECDSCIMRFGQNRRTLGHWPFLCNHNLVRIRTSLQMQRP